MRHTLLAVAFATLMAGMPAGAHHSFARYYFEDQSISIAGEAQEFRCRSPHALLLFMARTPEGQTQTYEAEWSNPGRLRRRGVDEDTLKPGGFVVVTGSPGRAGSENKVHLRSIHLPADGWSWTGQGRPGRRRR